MPAPCHAPTARLIAGLGDLVAPSFCLGCERDLRRRRRAPGPHADSPVAGLEPWLCGACRGRLEPIDLACRACGRGGTAGARCPACRGTAKGGIATTTALLRYRGAGRRLLHRLKYSRREVLAAPLGRALGRRLLDVRPDVVTAPDLLVVPVPLHLLRRWARGFNQAALIAEAAARAIDRPVVGPALRRRRATRPLFGVEPAERAAHVAGAFRARARHVAGRPVLLVDDIRTSGATLRAAAEALQAAGAARVDAAVVAR